METVIYSKGGGIGLILESQEDERDFIIPESVILHGKELQAGEFTVLDGRFTKPIRYAGIFHDEGSKFMVFHTGDHSDLFETKKYYYLYGWLNENRIFNCYTYGSGRDFHWRGDHWH